MGDDVPDVFFKQIPEEADWRLSEVRFSPYECPTATQAIGIWSKGKPMVQKAFELRQGHISLLLMEPRYRVSHRPRSVSGPTVLSVIPLMQKLSLLHVLSTGCTTLAQSLYSVMKDAFQAYFFDAHQNVADRLKKGVLICELTS
jgi:hypothetical protein